MQLYTRTGDHGMTGTLVGRVSKSSAQVAALGALDTLHAHLAVVFEEGYRTPVLSPGLGKHLRVHLLEVMHDLLDLGTHVSALTPVPGGWCRGPTLMSIRDDKYIFQATHMPVDTMEEHIDSMCASTPRLSAFILHTGSPLTAYVHVARTACRAAEAAVVAYLGESDGGVEVRDQLLLVYLNRLSDYLFALARLCTHVQEGVETVH